MNKKELLSAYEGLVDSHGLAKTWRELVLPAVAHNLRPDLSIDGFQTFPEVDPAILEGISDYNRAGEFYEMGLARENRDSKKKLGQYYTPRDVASFMADKLKAMVEENRGSFSEISLHEPCCGCGGLLFPMLELLDDPWEMLEKRVFLYDVDDVALDIARTFAILKYAPEGATCSLDDISATVGDFLASPVELGQDDAVIANPPYGKASDIPPGYQSAASRELYALFLEKCSRAGFSVFISPQSFLGSKKFSDLRRVLSEQAHGTVYPYDNIPSTIFCGRKHGIFNTNTSNSVRAAITCSVKGNGRWKVAPLIRFKAEERARLFEYSDELAKCASDAFGEEPWKKMPRCVEEVFAGDSRLGNLLGGKDAPYVLHVPSTPRYFTSATARNLSRSSQHIIRFADEESAALAYVILNSSLAYGWWRVCDGDLGLSQQTLKEIPYTQPDDEAMESIVRRFREQILLEDGRVVIKKNAGKDNENVFIGFDEIEANTRLILPGLSGEQYAALAAFHSNSVREQVRAWCRDEGDNIASAPAI